MSYPPLPAPTLQFVLRYGVHNAISAEYGVLGVEQNTLVGTTRVRPCVAGTLSVR